MLKSFGYITFAMALAAPAMASERLEAVAECVPAEQTLTYDCTIDLSQGGTPVDGAVFTVTPDMPSMPMAHNIAPVPAEAGDAPGRYTAPLTLDMHGQWVLKLEISAPERDLIVFDHEFQPE